MQKSHMSGILFQYQWAPALWVVLNRKIDICGRALAFTALNILNLNFFLRTDKG